jgi:Zn-dependent protease with chaperone function
VLPAVVAFVVVLAVALLLSLTAWLATLLALVAAGVVVVGGLVASGPLIRRLAGARPADPSQHARLFNQVDALCVANGIVEPELYVIDDPGPSAMAFGWRLEEPSIAVTTGLLEDLQIIELEAVMAHLLSRIRRGDTRIDTLVAMFVNLPLAPFGSAANRMAARFLTPQAEIAADLDGVRLTRYPPGLIGALVTMDSAEPQLQSSSRVIQHLWINEKSPALAGEWPASLNDRIAILREL